MGRRTWFFPVLVVFCVTSAAAQIIHVFNPWNNDPVYGSHSLYMTGGATGWNPGDNGTAMTDEGDGWWRMDLTSANIPEWADMEISGCSGVSNSGCTDRVNYSANPNVSELFSTASEVWLSPDGAGEFQVAYASPDARLVYFFAPWNNNIPQIRWLVGSVSTDWGFMRPDSSRCGWFWAAVPDSLSSAETSVSFRRSGGSVIVPASPVALPASLGANDTAWISNILENAQVAQVGDADPGDRGVCLDTNKIVHIQHPWMYDDLRDTLPIYISGNGISENQPLTEDEEEYWWSWVFDFDYRNDTYQIHSFYPAPTTDRLSYGSSFRPADYFSYGVYEIWLQPGDSGFDVLYDPPNPKYLHVLNPWNESVPRLVMGGDTLSMQSVDGKCGWYRRILDGNDLQPFRLIRAMGSGGYSQSGLQDSLSGPSISVDTLFSRGDSAWVMPAPYPTGAPVASAGFPGTLGDCPVRELAVMIFDWPDNVDFQNPVGCGGHVTGMVAPELNEDGLPQKATVMPADCDPQTFDQWFVPQELSSGYTNATCYDMTLELDNDGFWLADIAADKNRGIPGFFPINDFRWLDDAQTIANPNHSELADCNNLGMHNFHFTMHINAEFEYIPGQYFSFRGDDDVWVFINDTLVVDIGGVHGPVEGSVDLDTLGLEEGSTYPFAIFFAERNTCGSNFKMRTSIDLRTDRSLLHETTLLDSGRVQYDVKQIIRQSDLKCDFRVTESDPVPASANYTISGPQFTNGAQPLSSGTSFGGVTISEDYTSFVIDTLGIIRERALAPGQYTITFVHALDPSLNGSIQFTVPEYPLPEIRFVDSTGAVIDPDTIQLGEYAYVPYNVYVEAYFPYGHCDECGDELLLESPDSLMFMNADGNVTTSVFLKDGYAEFRIYAMAEISEGSFTVSSPTIKNTLLWDGLNFAEPPVPAPVAGGVYDRNGDGLADSIAVTFSRSISAEPPDSMYYAYPANDVKVRLDQEEIQTHLQSSTVFSVTAEAFSSGILTDQSGLSTFWFTSEEGQFEMTSPLQDRIGPVILDAQIQLGSNGFDTLYVTFSEGLNMDSVGLDDARGMLFFDSFQQGSRMRMEIDAVTVSWNSNYSRGIFAFFNDESPAAGDSVRIGTWLSSGAMPQDQKGNPAHVENQMVLITGKNRGEVNAVDYGEYRAEDFKNKDSSYYVILADPSLGVDDIVEQTGTLGLLIQSDLGGYILNNPDDPPRPEDIELVYEVWHYSSYGDYVSSDKGSILCSDPAIFNGNCSTTSGNLFVGWNYRSDSGRMVGTGVYPVISRYAVYVQGEKVEGKEVRFMWGVRRD